MESLKSLIEQIIKAPLKVVKEADGDYLTADIKYGDMLWKYKRRLDGENK